MGPDLSASVAGPPTEVGQLWLTVGTKTLAAVVQNHTHWLGGSQRPLLAQPERRGFSAGSPRVRQLTWWEHILKQVDKNFIEHCPAHKRDKTERHLPTVPPIRSLHKPLKQPHPLEGRQQKWELYNPAVLEQKLHYSKLEKKKKKNEITEEYAPDEKIT